MNGITLEMTNSVKDLGVDISSTLVWNEHISRIVGKCNRKMGMIKRTIGYNAPETVAKTLYSALIRSDLEYASSLWSGTSKSNMQLIENVQRRATKFILHYSNIDYKERLVKLDLLPLSLRREICDVNLFQRCINGHYDMLLDNFVVFNTPVQDRPITRSSSDHLKLIPQRCRTESHQLSFFHRIVPIWNQLPFHIRSALSFSSFKTQVHQFYQSIFSSKFDPTDTCTWITNCRCPRCRLQ
jgi:hypothetical protein